VYAVFDSVLNVLLPKMLIGFVVPPVEDNVPNVCPPPENVFADVDDMLIVEDAPLNVKPVDTAKVNVAPVIVTVLVPNVTLLVVPAAGEELNAAQLIL
jgi:hypothetical protein